MLRLLAKSGIASAAVSGVIFTSDSLTVIPSTRQDKTREENLKN